VAMMNVSRPGWRNPKVLSAILLVYLCGGITGALVLRIAANPGDKSHVGPYWKNGGKEISLQKWKKELELTPSQAAEIETILDDFVMYYDTLQAQMDEVRASGKAKIEQILDEKQRQKFGKMLLELQNRQIH
jgi:Spy/CpxP family protein refolding chaperone